MNKILPWKKSDVPVSKKLEHNPFLAIQSELDKAIKDFYSMFDMPQRLTEGFDGVRINPAIDIVDTKDSFKIEAELPGLSEEDVKVSIADGIVTIRGEKSTSKLDREQNYVMREINYGSYERSIALPDSVDIDKAMASFKKGMLWITIPKKVGALQHAHDVKVQKAA